MTKLNLISPQQKDSLTVDYLHLLIENVLGIFVIVAILFAIILIPLSENLVILDYQGQRTRDTALAKNQDITSKITDLNSLIGVYDGILSSSYSWSLLLVELSAVIPENVTLTHFKAVSDNSGFILKGFALKRDDLIKLIGNLEASRHFKEVKSPLNNYLQQQNIEFEIQGKI